MKFGRGARPAGAPQVTMSRPPTPYYHDRLVELEVEARETKARADATASWGSWTFYAREESLCIVRYLDATYECGWHYPTKLNFACAWAEIRTTALALAHTGDGQLWFPRGSKHRDETTKGD